jgi:hypothetical protein
MLRRRAVATKTAGRSLDMEEILETVIGDFSTFA